MSRGAAMHDFVMAMRFDRAAAEDTDAWKFLCRLAASFRDEDRQQRSGRKSWDDVDRVLERNPRLIATVVGKNVGGVRRKAGAR
jgi:hypothetical protein